MKKLLSIVFALTITTLPAMAGKRADCEQAITISQFTDWPDRYQTMAQNVLNTHLAEPMNTKYKTGVGCTAKCTAGQKLQDCVTPTQYKDKCAQIFANNLIKKQYESEFKQDLCGYISENEESNLEDMINDNEISYWVEYKKNNYTATSTSSDAAPRVESQSNASSAKTMTVSGTVVDKETSGPLLYANIAILNNPSKGTTTDENGNFILSDVPLDTKLKISFMGYETKEIHPGQNITIKMSPISKTLSEFQVTACRVDKEKGITDMKHIEGNCYPSACLEPRWILSGIDTNAQCVEQKCKIDNGTGEWIKDVDTWKCTLTECDTTKGWKKNDAGDACIEMLADCTDEQKAAHPNATKTGIKKGTETCIATECKCGYKLDEDKCVPWTKNEPCSADTKPKLPGNAKSAIMKCDGDKPYCEISDCNDGYKVSDDKKSCPSTRGDDCDATTVDKNATAGTIKKVKGKMVCVITDCARGFKPNKDGTKCVAGELSEADSQAKIDELKENAQKMKDKEQSTANKLLGAAGIGATGIGGMQLASAMAEQNADADAERAMRAYLATFHCNYNGGKNIAGGERDVELPGGNELINLYSEYVNLANDLKTRKTALDMRPGIESESILDAATSGLYDDVAIGKTSGAYTSLARALMDPNGADAAAWAAQKEETAKKKKTGMITAGIGAAGSLVGNLAINSGKDKQNKVDEILNKYDKKKQLLDELESNIAAIPPQTAQCPNGTTGTSHPDCTCTGNKKIFNPKTTTCEDCPGDLVVIDGKCKCPSDKPLSAPDSDKCYAMPQQCTPKCDLKSDPNLQVLLDCSCTCQNNFDYKDGNCTCEGANKRVVDGQCQIVTVETVTETEIIVEKETIVEQILTETETITGATLPTDSLFDLGKSTLRDEAKLHISNFINELSENGYTNCSIQIDGYTDPLGKWALNKTLSQQRANAVRTYISGLRSDITVTATGHGETNCTCGAGTAQNRQINYDNYEYSICKNKAAEFKPNDNARYAPCRRVVITPTCDKTTTTVTTK